MRWEVKPLGELCSIQNGFAFKSKLFGDDGMPLIRIRDLSNGFETQTRYSGEYDENFVVNAGDVLVGMDGEFRCYEWKGGPALLNQRVCRLEGFDRRLSPRYTHYGINKYLKAIEEVTSFTTVKHLSAKKIKAIQFPIPALDEQERIVGVLDEAFAAIDKAKANVERNLTNARELFQSRINDIFSNPSEDWEVKPLGEVCELISGQHIKADDYNRSQLGIGYLTGPSDFGSISPIVSKWTEYPKRLALKEDVLVTVKGSGVGSSNFMIESELAISRQLVALRSHELLPMFLFDFIRFSQEVISEKANGAAIPGISRGDILELMIAVPPRGRQTELLDEIGLLREQISALEIGYQAELNNLEELRQSILEQAFEGKLTEPVAA